MLKACLALLRQKSKKDGVSSPHHRGASREPRRWPRRILETESPSLELERFNENFVLLSEPTGGYMAIAYDSDFIGWLDHQARLLRTHNHDELDYDNLAEEVEAMSRSQRRELKNRYTVLLMHLLKWQYQPDYRCTSWRSTIFQQRLKIKRLIRDMPSIKNEFNDSEWQIDAWDDAVTEASAETSIFKENFPKTCVWTVDQVLSDYLPE